MFSLCSHSSLIFVLIPRQTSRLCNSWLCPWVLTQGTQIWTDCMYPGPCTLDRECNMDPVLWIQSVYQLITTLPEPFFTPLAPWPRVWLQDSSTPRLPSIWWCLVTSHSHISSLLTVVMSPLTASLSIIQLFYHMAALTGRITASYNYFYILHLENTSLSLR